MERYTVFQGRVLHSIHKNEEKAIAIAKSLADPHDATSRVHVRMDGRDSRFIYWQNVWPRLGNFYEEHR